MPFTYPTLESGVEEGVWYAKVSTWVCPAEEQVRWVRIVASLQSHPPPAGSVLVEHHSSVHVSLVAGRVPDWQESLMATIEWKANGVTALQKVAQGSNHSS